jgi:hypothetical protein
MDRKGSGMKCLLSAFAVVVAMVTIGGPTAAQEVIPPECNNLPLPDTGCVVEHYKQFVGDDGNEIYPLPASITHYACTASGQAPAGAIDETVDLQAWINSVPDGNGFPGAPTSTDIPHFDDWHILDFPDGRCIRMDGQLTIEDRNYLIFDGGGVTLDQHLKGATAATQEIMTWYIRRGSYLQWHSFKVIGNHPEKQISLGVPTKVSTYGSCHDGSGATCEWQAAFRFAGTQHALLDGNETWNTHGDSVEIGWDYPTQPPEAIDARYITVRNHKVYGAGRQGISAVSGQDITITDSYIEGAAQVGIDIEQEQPLFPVRRWTITNNVFGQSYATIAQLGAANTCTEVSDITFSHNQQVEPNITSWPALFAQREVAGQPPCSAKRGPLTITHNNFLVEEWYYDSDVAVIFDDYSNITFSDNSIKHVCYPGTTCYLVANEPDGAAVALHGGSGHVLNRNNLAVGGGQSWPWVYSYDGVVHGSSGPLGNVSSCGNTTAQGPNQPMACPLPLA